MFRKRISEILRYGLKSLNKLDTAEAAECSLTIPVATIAKGEGSRLTGPAKPSSLSEMDSAIIEALSANFNPFDPV